jgi:F-type H+-transporting ATPase subunit delta
LRAESVALNYAEALFAMADGAGQAAAYGEWLEAVAGAVEATPAIEAVLMSPRVTKTEKGRILAQALPKAPRPFVLFLQSVVKRGRQNLLGLMATQYEGLLDTRLNRVRASVIVARPASAKLQAEIVTALSAVTGKEVLARFSEDPSLLGGVLVKVGARIYDGSLRLRVASLRRQLLH